MPRPKNPNKSINAVMYYAKKDGLGWTLKEVTVEGGEVRSERDVFSDVFDIFRVKAVQYLLGDA